MAERAPRPRLLIVPVAIYGIVGLASLRNLVLLLPDAGDIPLPDLLAVLLWTVLPLALAICLGLRLRWAWWLGLFAPGLLILAMVAVLGAIFFRTEGGVLIGIGGGFGSLLPTLGVLVAAAALLAPVLRKWFAA